MSVGGFKVNIQRFMAEVRVLTDKHEVATLSDPEFVNAATSCSAVVG